MIAQRKLRQLVYKSLAITLESELEREPQVIFDAICEANGGGTYPASKALTIKAVKAVIRRLKKMERS